MRTVREVAVALLFIASGFGLDVLLPTWMAVLAGIAACVGFLVRFARPVRPVRPARPASDAPSAWWPAGDELNLN